MSVLVIILAFLCLAIGVIGSVIPGLPGPPIAWGGVLLASLTPWCSISGNFIGITLAVAVVITLLDYIIPSLTTKRMGGSKYGIWGCNIGLVISMFGLPFGPAGLLGVVFWPFLGALVGELLNQNNLQPSLKAAVGAFLGFLTGTLLKLAYCIVLLVVVVAALF
ncbi:MAG: DUF456 domain-containing protein [Bacteroidales bacterium]|jgi:uncharacterized protein YqgC (DUF456 family)|nr:DUF456 domain-containing protein [Bacteroidales bacterium]